MSETNTTQKVIAPSQAAQKQGEVYFDYDKQSWVSVGHYIRCGHPENTNCDCYGRLHEGQEAA